MEQSCPFLELFLHQMLFLIWIFSNQLLRYLILKVLNSKVEVEINQVSAEEQQALHEYHQLLRVIAKVALQDKFEHSSLDQHKVFQICSDLEERGIRIMGPVMQIFEGERSQVRVCLENHANNECVRA